MGSSYAAGTKPSELSLSDEPGLGVGVPPPQEGSPPATGAAPGPKDKVTDLRLADEPEPAIEILAVKGGPPASLGGTRASVAPSSVDIYLAEATREFAAGHIDQLPWLRALNQAFGDAEVAKPAYLRARANALRIAKRDQRAERLAQANEPGGAEEPSTAGSRGIRSGRGMLVAGSLAIVVVVATTVFFVMRSPSDPLPPTASAKAPAQDAKPKQPTPRDNAKSAPGNASAAKPATVLSEDFAKKVQELKDAGNWNVLVLYAVEWTRKVPASPDAWNELSMGYVKLRQFNDALEAGTKAVQLAPENFQAWQTLGEINVALKQPATAVTAYERAAALNGRDVTSLVQIGTLNAQLGHLAEARVAFTQALDVSPTDVDALCGAESIAQKEARPKDAEAFARQLKAADLRCRDATPVEAVSVAPVIAAKKKSSGFAQR